MNRSGPNELKGKRIWIDFANSPHVLFFLPLIKALQQQGHEVVMTHRNFAQTEQLCVLHQLRSKRIGQHGGQGIARKLRNLFSRAWGLYKFARNQRVDLAVSHNSYAHGIAAKLLRKNYITIMDYEFQPANHISFRLADRILVPFTFKLEAVSRYGASQRKLKTYPGFKEEVYLNEFLPDPDFWQKEFPDVDLNKVICVVRPPATMAAYHNFENRIFDRLLSYLLVRKDVRVLIFPRTPEQKTSFEEKFSNLSIVDKVVNGPQLVAHSDLVISAGGTMNREAAILGVPAYTVFAGQKGSVDEHMIRSKKILEIDSIDQFERIHLEKKECAVQSVSPAVFNFILNEITTDQKLT